MTPIMCRRESRFLSNRAAIRLYPLVVVRLGQFVGWVYSPTASRGTVDASVGEYAHPTFDRRAPTNWAGHQKRKALRQKPKGFYVNATANEVTLPPAGRLHARARGLATARVRAWAGAR